MLNETDFGGFRFNAAVALPSCVGMWSFQNVSPSVDMSQLTVGSWSSISCCDFICQFVTLTSLRDTFSLISTRKNTLVSQITGSCPITLVDVSTRRNADHLVTSHYLSAQLLCGRKNPSRPCDRVFFNSLIARRILTKFYMNFYVTGGHHGLLDFSFCSR
jgi:hypothetical protein